MKSKRALSLILACVLLVSFCPVNAGAAEIHPTPFTFHSAALARNSVDNGVSVCSTKAFDVTVSANTAIRASNTIALMAEDTMRITALYTPASAKLYLGLVDSSNTYYYFTVTGGSVDQAITITKNDAYYFMIMNTESYAVNISGFLTY